MSTAVYGGAGEEFSITSEESIPSGFAFNGDGTKLFVIGVSGTSIVEYTLSTAYDVSSATYGGIGEELDVSGEEVSPQDIVFNLDGTKMFILGAADNEVDEYTLSPAYDVSAAVFSVGESFDVSGEEIIATGMAFNRDGSVMFVIGEDGDAVVEYALSVDFDVSTAVYSGAGEEFDFSGEEGTAEGMAFNTEGTKLFIVGVDNDSVIEYTLSTAFDVSTASYAGSGEELDVSALEASPTHIAFDQHGTKLFVLGFGGDDVIEYSIDPGDYAEASANDGTINNGSPLVLSLELDTFQDVDADNVLDIGSEVTIANVPAGLTATMTLSNADSTVTLTFTGAANSHVNIDDVSDITFVFDDSAFTSNDASTITASGDGGAYSSNVGIDFLRRSNASRNVQHPSNILVSYTAAVCATDGYEVVFRVTAQDATGYILSRDPALSGAVWKQMENGSMEDTVLFPEAGEQDAFLLLRSSTGGLSNLVSLDVPVEDTCPLVPHAGVSEGSEVAQDLFESEIEEEDTFVQSGDLIRSPSFSAVYLVDEELKRKPFSNEAIYFSHYTDFDDVQTVSDEQLASLALGSAVLPAPGQWLKIQSVPDVFEIAEDGRTLLLIESEERAFALRGEEWADTVMDIDVILFPRFSFESN